MRARDGGPQPDHLRESFAATLLLCHWLVRDRDRKLVALDAARAELGDARDERDAATLQRDAAFAERAALDHELKRLVQTCDRLAEQRERASLERDRAKREQTRAADGASQERPPTTAHTVPSPPRGLGVRSEAPASEWPLAPFPAAAMLRSWVHPPMRARVLAIAAITVALVVLLIVVSTT